MSAPKTTSETRVGPYGEKDRRSYYRRATA